jgi:hypothetical protein
VAFALQIVAALTIWMNELHMQTKPEQEYFEGNTPRIVDIREFKIIIPLHQILLLQTCHKENNMLLNLKHITLLQRYNLTTSFMSREITLN